jgi:lipopolysaccharide transport system ATP-binding protein
MSETAIKVEGLSKRYRIGAQQRAYRTLREKLNETAMAPFRAMKSLSNGIGNGNGNGHKAKSETFWALKDISFEIKAGEAVGIIGRNGAGKSTLLKILSRITEPTEGYADINGRIASLLEVGTGFHPELSGRENIFLNGSILGMKRAEIRRKFDEMVAFAEIEKFIDTPVKHYSSGMYVRLAFAVAAHLDPEILLVDEVLAVGDAEFQKKCLGKMGDVAREGRTVLFVSHNLGAINRLCGSAIWINDGKLQLAGESEEVVTRYLSSGAQFSGERRWSNSVDAPGTDEIRLLAVRISNGDREQAANFDVRRPLNVEIEYELLASLPRFRTAFRLVASDGTVILTSAESSNNGWDQTIREPGKYTSWCQIPGNFLNVGQYGITVSCDIPFVRALFFVENCLNFHVEETGSHSSRFPERWPGLICPKFDWQLERLDRESVACGAASD